MPKTLRRAIAALIRNRKFHVSSNISNKDLLDIGCGSHIREEFITVDYNWRRKLDICWDITQGLPLADDTVGGVFSEHCIEHISLASGDALIAEIFRVMKPGALLRLIVPDGALYLNGYAKVTNGLGGDASDLPYAEQDDFHGIYHPIMSVNRIFHEHGHKFIYDFHMLTALLSRNGFCEIERRAYRESDDERLLNDTERRAPESLYVEARKPALA